MSELIVLSVVVAVTMYTIAPILNAEEPKLESVHPRPDRRAAVAHTKAMS